MKEKKKSFIQRSLAAFPAHVLPLSSCPELHAEGCKSRATFVAKTQKVQKERKDK